MRPRKSKEKEGELLELEAEDGNQTNSAEIAANINSRPFDLLEKKYDTLYSEEDFIPNRDEWEGSFNFDTMVGGIYKKFMDLIQKLSIIKMLLNFGSDEEDGEIDLGTMSEQDMESFLEYQIWREELQGKLQKEIQGEQISILKGMRENLLQEKENAMIAFKKNLGEMLASYERNKALAEEEIENIENTLNGIQSPDSIQENGFDGSFEEEKKYIQMFDTLLARKKDVNNQIGVIEREIEQSQTMIENIAFLEKVKSFNKNYRLLISDMRQVIDTLDGDANNTSLHIWISGLQENIKVLRNKSEMFQNVDPDNVFQEGMKLYRSFRKTTSSNKFTDFLFKNMRQPIEECEKLNGIHDEYAQKISTYQEIQRRLNNFDIGEKLSVLGELSEELSGSPEDILSTYSEHLNALSKRITKQEDLDEICTKYTSLNEKNTVLTKLEGFEKLSGLNNLEYYLPEKITTLIHQSRIIIDIAGKQKEINDAIEYQTLYFKMFPTLKKYIETYESKKTELDTQINKLFEDIETITSPKKLKPYLISFAYLQKDIEGLIGMLRKSLKQGIENHIPSEIRIVFDVLVSEIIVLQEKIAYLQRVSNSYSRDTKSLNFNEIQENFTKEGNCIGKNIEIVDNRDNPLLKKLYDKTLKSEEKKLLHEQFINFIHKFGSFIDRNDKTVKYMLGDKVFVVFDGGNKGYAELSIDKLMEGAILSETTYYSQVGEQEEVKHFFTQAEGDTYSKVFPTDLYDAYNRFLQSNIDYQKTLKTLDGEKLKANFYKEVWKMEEMDVTLKKYFMPLDVIANKINAMYESYRMEKVLSLNLSLSETLYCLRIPAEEVLLGESRLSKSVLKNFPKSDIEQLRGKDLTQLK